MSKTISGLCVGGPYDGKLMECMAHSFVVAEIPEGPFTVEPADVIETTEIKQTEYVSMNLGLEDVPAYIWRPLNQTPLKTVELLISGYNPKDKNNDK